MSRRERRLDILQRPGLVKICGLREPIHAVAAASAGADLIGLVFAPSKRKVTVQQAQLIATEVRLALGEAAPLLAGVFVDPNPAEVRDAASLAGLDVVQLHGDQPVSRYAYLGLPIIRAYGPPPGSNAGDVIAWFERQRLNPVTPAMLFIDAHDPVSHGGTGRRADWDLAAGVALQAGLMLAGGLSPANVAEAIARVRPQGVDVSSGVERDGAKDVPLIQEFIRNARHAFLNAASPASRSAALS